MRVLLCVERFFGDVHGGSYRVAWDCAKHLSAAGHDVTILCESLDASSGHETEEGVSILRYGLARRGWNVAGTRRKLAASALTHYYGASKPDIIWGHSPFQFLGATDAYPRITAVYTVHSPVSEEMRQSGRYNGAISSLKITAGRRFEQVCLRRSRRILVLSQFTRELLHRIHEGRFESKIVIAPGWADTQRYVPRIDQLAIREMLGWRSDVPILFCLRRLVPRMGVDALVSAAAIIKNSGMRFALYIGGEGEMHEALASQIRTAGLGDEVKLIGALAEQQLAPAYAACDAFVIPTRALECFGLIAIEAMATGTPVLSTPVGALPEIIRPFEPQWLAAGNTPEEIAVLLTRFLRGELPAHAADEVRRYVMEKYDARTACAKFCELAISA